MDVNAVQAHNPRGRWLEKRVAIAHALTRFAPLRFQPLGGPVYLHLNGRGIEVLGNRQHLLEQLDGEAIRHQGRKLRFQIHQLRRGALGQEFRQRAEGFRAGGSQGQRYSCGLSRLSLPKGVRNTMAW